MAELPAIARCVPLAPMQRLATEHLARGLRESVPVTLHSEADAEALIALRARLNAAAIQVGRPRITYTHLIVKAVAQTLRAHGVLNASLEGRVVHHYADVNIGVAISLADGNLIVPVIRDADRCPVDTIASVLDRLEKTAAAGKLQLADVRGATFTVSNGGIVPSARWTTPIIPHKQAAILALGAVHEAVTVRNGRIEATHKLPASLTFDHRFVNGMPAARFLDHLLGLIAEPSRIDLGI